MTDLQKLQHIVITDIKTIPYFIDGKKQNHKIIFEHIQMIFRVVLRLIKDKVLSYKQIREYDDMCSGLITSMVECIGKDEVLEIEVSSYILTQILFYEEESIRFEVYEVTQNLVNFQKIYQSI